MSVLGGRDGGGVDPHTSERDEMASRNSESGEMVGTGDEMDLSGILMVGATYDGLVLTSIHMTWDGGEMRSRLPTPGDQVGVSSRLQQQILTALASAGAVTRKQLARLLNRASASGRFAVECSALLEAGKIFERNSLLADDESKLPP